MLVIFDVIKEKILSNRIKKSNIAVRKLNLWNRNKTLKRFSLFVGIIFISSILMYKLYNMQYNFLLPYIKSIQLPFKSITLEELKNNKTSHFNSLTINKDDPEVSVLSLDNAYVFEDGKIISNKGEVVEDYMITAHKLNPNFQDVYDIKILPNPYLFKGKLAIIASAGENLYYNWLFEILPRIEILRQSQIDYDKIYIYNLKSPFQRETLKTLQIDDEKLFYGYKGMLVRAKELIIPSIPLKIIENNEYPQWVIKFLNDNFLVKDKVWNYPKKIFISRSKAVSRRIVNEKDVINALKTYGFELINLENLTVREQASIFNNIDTVIGVHGAGLSNLVFSRDGTKVIEIQSSENTREFFKQLALQKNLNYQSFNTTNEHLDSEQLINEDVFVDIDKLLKTLKSMN